MSLYDFPTCMDLRHLRYFMAVAETQNLHRASETLNIVQSAYRAGFWISNKNWG